VQARLDGHPYTRPSEHTFAYSGLVTCGLCGCAYTAEVKKKVYIYYRCAKNCVRGVKYVPERRMSEMIGLHVAKLCFPAHLRDHVIDALKSSRRLVAEETKARITEATQRIDRLSRMIDKAYEDKLDGRIDHEFFVRKRMEWDEQRAEAVREVERLNRTNSASLEAGIRVFELANDAYNLYSEREPLQQRELLKWLFSNFTFADGELLGDLAKALLAPRRSPR
jgi:site-specific DNA recombinase